MPKSQDKLFRPSQVWTVALSLYKGWEPCSSGYGRRLKFDRAWVQIPAPYTGWSWHFFTFICSNNLIICLKRPKINEKEAGDGTFSKIKRSCEVYLWNIFLKIGASRWRHQGVLKHGGRSLWRRRSPVHILAKLGQIPASFFIYCCPSVLQKIRKWFWFQRKHVGMLNIRPPPRPKFKGDYIWSFRRSKSIEEKVK